MLNKKRIGHERQYGIRSPEFRQAPLIRGVVNCCQASRRPPGRLDGCPGKLIDERLCIASTPRVTGGTEHQGRNRCS